MGSIVIKVENLSKQYRLGEIGTGSLKDDMKRWRYKLMGKEDPFLTIGEENDRTVKTELDYVWALRDINLEIERGDIVGVIGRNGAGKSTLLKILSRTTGPTVGTVKMKGRVASLLEVGTGFHGELSGRENIYLNGAILGMQKKEIKKKFDEIVAFSGVERYIDTPVKRYSSGMYVRLAFAVAAHLESEILIIDEVLAVGDAEFQRKCLGKIGEVSEGEGKTVLFVSHNLGAVSSLCKKSLLLYNGKVHSFGPTRDVINTYFNIGINADEKPNLELYRAYDIKNSAAYITDISVSEKGFLPQLGLGEKFSIKIILKCIKPVNNGTLQILFFNSEGVSTDYAYSPDDTYLIAMDKPGDYELIFTPSSFDLSPGRYKIGVGLTPVPSDISVIWDAIHHFPIFEIQNKGQVSIYPNRPWAIHHLANNNWILNKLNS